MEELLQILKRVKPEVDFENEDALVDDEILDSFDVIAIITALNKAYDINISIANLLPKNLNDVNAIYSLVQEALEDLHSL